MEVWEEIEANPERGAQRLIDEYGNRLYAAASVLCPDQSAAEDLVSRTLAQAIRKIGRYATCGVMGATWWARPNWIGRPVQWCGLVYAAALYEYARLCSADEVDFWRTVADGIVASGIKQSHTEDEPALQGLLPDSVDLERQTRYPVPINPGTLQENMAEMQRSPYHMLCAFSGDKPVPLRMAGGAAGLTRNENVLSCQIKAWPETDGINKGMKMRRFLIRVAFCGSASWLRVFGVFATIYGGERK